MLNLYEYEFEVSCDKWIEDLYNSQRFALSSIKVVKLTQRGLVKAENLSATIFF